MSSRRDERQQHESYLWRALPLALCIVFLADPSGAFGQTQAGESPQAASSAPVRAPSVPGTPLKDLLAEAEKNNPQIEAARQRWEAAKQVPSQVSTLPDPQFTLAQGNVGSPRPFAGFSNDEFSYIGLGVMQEIPYPGKLRLRGEVAKQDASVAQQQLESFRRSVLDEVKAAYFRISYLSTTLGIVNGDAELLKQVEKAADAHYRSGMGTQQDLLRAQLERTKLLRYFAMHDLEIAHAQSQLKQLLGRPQSSPNIKPVDLSNTQITYTFDDLLAAADNQSPDIAAAEQMVQKQKLRVDLAHKDFYPDFNVQYTWERTDPDQFRARYALQVGVQVPIYHGRKQRPELAEAQADLNRSHSEAESQLQQVAFQLRTAYDTEEETAKVLNIYQDGLLPQTRAEFQSGLADYQNNRQDFQALLASFLDLLHLDEEYWQDLADHETALARLEELTGLSLRQEGAQQ
jgi:outer membrane protein, heavy metal efflux system